jgi:hypothetical protein
MNVKWNTELQFKSKPIIKDDGVNIVIIIPYLSRFL